MQHATDLTGWPVLRVAAALLAVALAFAPGSLHAQPRLAVIGGESVDWGTHVPGTLIRNVKVTNVGTDTLKISGVIPSCGCTTAPLDRFVLGRGDTATMAVKVNMSVADGVQEKTVTITSNDPARPSVGLTLRATIRRGVVALQSTLLLPSGAKAGKEYPVTFELRNDAKEPIGVDAPKFEGDSGTRARFNMIAPYSLSPGERLMVTAFVTSDRSGPIVGRIRVRTSGTAEANVEIPVEGVVRGASTGKGAPRRARGETR